MTYDINLLKDADRYLKMAFIDLQTTHNHIKMWDVDDNYLVISCKNLYEGIEYCLLYVAKASGVQVSCGHNLRRLLDTVSEWLLGYTWYTRLKKLVRHMCSWNKCTMIQYDYKNDAKYATQAMIVLEQMILDLRNFKSVSSDSVLIKERVQRILDNSRVSISVNDVFVLLPEVYRMDASISADNLYNAVMLAVRIKG